MPCVFVAVVQPAGCVFALWAGSGAKRARLRPMRSSWRLFGAIRAIARAFYARVRACVQQTLCMRRVLPPSPGDSSRRCVWFALFARSHEGFEFYRVGFEMLLCERQRRFCARAASPSQRSAGHRTRQHPHAIAARLPPLRTGYSTAAPQTELPCPMKYRQGCRPTPCGGRSRTSTTSPT